MLRTCLFVFLEWEKFEGVPVYQQKSHLFCFKGLLTVIGKDNQMSCDIGKRKIRANRKPYQYIFFIFFHSRDTIQMLSVFPVWVHVWICMYVFNSFIRYAFFSRQVSVLYITSILLTVLWCVIFHYSTTSQTATVIYLIKN